MQFAKRATRWVKKALVIGEKETFQRISEFLPLANSANEILARMVLGEATGEALTRAMEEVKDIEKRADELSFSVTESITGGAVSPNAMDNLLKAVETADSIIDHYYNLSREVERMVNAGPAPSRVEEEFAPLFRTMLESARMAFGYLERLLSASTVEDLVAARRAIQLLEERGDDVKDRGFDRLYAMASEISYIQFTHYSEVLHKFDDVLDACEDLSDLIVSIVVSVLG